MTFWPSAFPAASATAWAAGQASAGRIRRSSTHPLPTSSGSPNSLPPSFTVCLATSARDTTGRERTLCEPHNVRKPHQVVALTVVLARMIAMAHPDHPLWGGSRRLALLDELDKHPFGRCRVKERHPVPPGPRAWFLIDRSEPFRL